MKRKAEFGTREEYKEVVEFFGEPPCGSCMVRPMCKKESHRKTYGLILEDCCDQMDKWLMTVRRNLLKRQMAKFRTNEAYRKKLVKRVLKMAEKQLKS